MNGTPFVGQYCVLLTSGVLFWIKRTQIRPEMKIKPRQHRIVPHCEIHIKSPKSAWNMYCGSYAFLIK